MLTTAISAEDILLQDGAHSALHDISHHADLLDTMSRMRATGLAGVSGGVATYTSYKDMPPPRVWVSEFLSHPTPDLPQIDCK